MGFRRFMFHGVSMVRDEGDLACAALNCAGRGRWASRRPSPRAAREGNARSVTAQHGSGGAVGAPEVKVGCWGGDRYAASSNVTR